MIYKTCKQNPTCRINIELQLLLFKSESRDLSENPGMN